MTGFRVDPLTGRQVVIAPGRAARPGAKRGEVEPPSQAELDECPFCKGREDRTPPETYAIGPPDRAPDTPGWQVRVVPNKYPAFEGHEVVVHTPRHVRSVAELTDEELDLVAQAWRARADGAAGEGFSYVHALVNEGKEAGASLPHSHSQLVWLRESPPAVAEERGSGCRLCELLARERSEQTRVVTDRDGLLASTAYAGRFPYETLIAPLEHEGDGLRSELLPRALRGLADIVRRLIAVEGQVPLNAWLHSGDHWHFELVSRLSVPAGIELGAGIYVNLLAPEEAATRLRNA